ncbi:putative Mo25-like family protein [Monocercomonoides exilis]|uniref:putative Mo25-like family protein n=1 Tax=Monocercomonoides exilis TaxID=2049356 RepID=UPI003559B2E1|nr:putative Mo25-like family protein [Monocercomonoides exilis]|eukprot:MONOS_11500.1-p1 / transcript=MONOS_11500.1 / gene=MONOS_11500 / organism=Monocercomonoides_exilis_PA203 / gene_product=Mo25-like family protein / transcript_product=Mo25-like family protein / location=Mono_scaffold00581:1253-3242(+) / protein_length=313 / sequence_SO=supercontig / SO=protein_coding / is_pseudo=false
MSFLSFRPKPADFVKSLSTALHLIAANKEVKAVEKGVKDSAKAINSLKILLYGDAENEPSKDALSQIVTEIIASNTLVLMMIYLGSLEFEARKNCTTVFNALVHREPTNELVIRHILEHPEIIRVMLVDFQKSKIALSLGSMFRECIRSQALAKLAIEMPEFSFLFHYVELENFELASDAFTSFKDILTRHKQIVSEYLQTHYNSFFDNYTALLSSANYATRRQSVKLLSDLLFDRQNYFIMMRYIADAQNLRRIMTLLRDSSKAIQFESFHVFKVFVMNPEKPEQIAENLIKFNFLVGFVISLKLEPYVIHN